MECITWFTPILPGKLDEWKSMVAEMNGPRREEHGPLEAAQGVTREVASLMQTPQGDFVCLFHESEDLAKAFQTIADLGGSLRRLVPGASGERARDDGGDAAGPIPATLFFDYRADG